MKIALLADLHIGVSKSNDVYHDYFEKFFIDFFKFTKENNIKHVIQTGDMFDYRKEVHFNTLHRSQKYFFDQLMNQGIELFVVCGNHDSLYTNTNRINSVRLIASRNDNTTVVDSNPQTINIGGLDIDLYPWVCKENQEQTHKFIKESESKVCVGHFEFAHFLLAPGNEIETGMDHRLFKNYEHVLSGHYHTHSMRDNVNYLGTPYELTWIDCNDPKGFWTIDTETLKMERYINPHKLFVKIEYVDGLEYDFDALTGVNVKIVETVKSDVKKFEAFLVKVNAAKPLSVKVIESSVVDAVAEAVGKKVDVVSTQSVIMNVLDGVETTLDRGILKQKVAAKYNEALSILNSVA